MKSGAVVAVSTTSLAGSDFTDGVWIFSDQRLSVASARLPALLAGDGPPPDLPVGGGRHGIDVACRRASRRLDDTDHLLAQPGVVAGRDRHFRHDALDIRLAAVNLTVFAAGICIWAPVAGLRPTRAARAPVENEPKPTSCSSCTASPALSACLMPRAPHQRLRGWRPCCRRCDGQPRRLVLVCSRTVLLCVGKPAPSALHGPNQTKMT
jgi:hypothetical protein